MKKTYISPEMFAVKLQHQTHLMEASITAINGNGNDNSQTDIDYGGESGEGEGFLGKGFTSKDLWDNEW